MTNYEVGYAKPPRNTQFKPGQSGNRAGRTRGSRNTYTIFEKLVGEKVLVTQDGTKIKITKKEAILMQLINAASKGDLKAIQTLFPHMIASDAKTEERANAIATLKQDDKKIIEQFMKGGKDEQTNSERHFTPKL